MLGRTVAVLARRLADDLLSLVFPTLCVLCGEPVDSLADGITCAACWSDVGAPPTSARCPRCHAPKSAEATTDCPGCRGMVLDGLRYIGPYQGVLRAHVLFLKRRPQVCRRLREKIQRVLAEESAFRDVAIVLPVPLHPRRLRERGYNQAELLAEEAARALARPLEKDVLRRILYTEPHRAGMDALARARRVAGSFAVTSAEAVRGRVILLVDDVFTSGATLNECARTLRRSGARAVYGFVLARALA